MNLAGLRVMNIHIDRLRMSVWTLAFSYDAHVDTFELQAAVNLVAAGETQKAAKF